MGHLKQMVGFQNLNRFGGLGVSLLVALAYSGCADSFLDNIRREDSILLSRVVTFSTSSVDIFEGEPTFQEIEVGLVEPAQSPVTLDFSGAFGDFMEITSDDGSEVVTIDAGQDSTETVFLRTVQSFDDDFYEGNRVIEVEFKDVRSDDPFFNDKEMPSLILNIFDDESRLQIDAAHPLDADIGVEETFTYIDLDRFEFSLGLVKEDSVVTTSSLDLAASAVTPGGEQPLSGWVNSYKSAIRYIFAGLPSNAESVYVQLNADAVDQYGNEFGKRPAISDNLSFDTSDGAISAIRFEVDTDLSVNPGVFSLESFTISLKDFRFQALANDAFITAFVGALRPNKIFIQEYLTGDVVFEADLADLGIASADYIDFNDVNLVFLSGSTLYLVADYIYEYQSLISGEIDSLNVQTFTLPTTGISVDVPFTDTAYITTNQPSLLAVDLSDGAVFTAALSGAPAGLATGDNFVAVATAAGTDIFDVATADSPVLDNTIGAGAVSRVAAKDTGLVVAGASDVTYYNMTDLSAPATTGSDVYTITASDIALTPAGIYILDGGQLSFFDRFDLNSGPQASYSSSATAIHAAFGYAITQEGSVYELLYTGEFY